MNKSTVWYWSYRKRYYLLRPWKWIREFFVNLRNAHMRATRGWCYMDVWNFNDWFTGIAPDMLRHMADKGCAYPGTEPFETPEKWHEWLHKMADRIENLDILEEKNEYNKEMKETLLRAIKRWKEHHPDEKLSSGQEFTEEEEELRKKYLERDQEISKKRETFIQETFTELGKHWDCLWD